MLCRGKWSVWVVSILMFASLHYFFFCCLLRLTLLPLALDGIGCLFVVGDRCVRSLVPVSVQINGWSKWWLYLVECWITLLKIEVSFDSFLFVCFIICRFTWIKWYIYLEIWNIEQPYSCQSNFNFVNLHWNSVYPVSLFPGFFITLQ